MSRKQNWFGVAGVGLAVAVAVIVLLPQAADGGGGRSMRGVVRIDGSSTVFPITEAVAEEFGAEYRRVRVTVGISGTGGGFKRFASGETDVSNASRPIRSKEMASAKSNGVEFVELPIAYDGLTVVVNKANDWCDTLTVEELRRIFLAGSTVKTWQDLRDGWPAEPVKIYSPGTDSGTFDYFKEVIAGKTGSVRSDMSVSEDDNILVRGVAGQKGAIGFFGCAYYFENSDKLKALSIENDSEAVHPTRETIESGQYAPFSRPLLIYVNAKSLDRPEVTAFVTFYLENAAELADEVGYVRLPQSLYDRVAANVAARRTGTQFLDDQNNKRHGPLTDIYR